MEKKVRIRNKMLFDVDVRFNDDGSMSFEQGRANTPPESVHFDEEAAKMLRIEIQSYDIELKRKKDAERTEQQELAELKRLIGKHKEIAANHIVTL